VLVELRLENYAVIDNMAVEFASGLNLLTARPGRKIHSDRRTKHFFLEKKPPVT